MKAIVFNVKEEEKQILSLANGKKHDITMISNEINLKTVVYACGKQVVVLSSYDILDYHLIKELKMLGVSRVISRSCALTHVDLKAAEELEMEVVQLSSESGSIQEIANQMIGYMDFWERESLNKVASDEGVICNERK